MCVNVFKQKQLNWNLYRHNYHSIFDIWFRNNTFSKAFGFNPFLSYLISVADKINKNKVKIFPNRWDSLHPSRLHLLSYLSFSQTVSKLFLYPNPKLTATIKNTQTCSNSLQSEAFSKEVTWYSSIFSPHASLFYAPPLYEQRLDMHFVEIPHHYMTHAWKLQLSL